VSRIVVLDAGPLGMATNPRASPLCLECQTWLESLLRHGRSVVVPEISDYEVRRELLRAGKVRGLRRLDELARVIDYLPITTEAMRKAAQLWAEVRRAGRPTAHPEALDGDVILAAQAATLAQGVDEVIIATTNVGHLSRFADAREWRLVQ
jgi:predicted nucleic acid-binding protein